MARAWPVTDLALDVAQFFDVYHRRTTRLVVAGDMTAHAVEIELLVRRRKRSVRARVLSVVPEFAFALVAGAAHLDAYIVALASRRGQRQLVFEDILIVLVDALVIAIHQTLHRLLAAERGAHFDQTVLKEASLHGNLGLRAGLLLGFQPLQIGAARRQIGVCRVARAARRRDPRFELGDTPDQTRALGRLRGVRTIGEFELVVAHEQVDHSQRL